MAKLKIKKGDHVVVLTGKDKGKHGEVLVAATGLRAGDHIVFMSEADVASLPELIWRHGAPVVAVLVLWIALQPVDVSR